MHHRTLACLGLAAAAVLMFFCSSNYSEEASTNKPSSATPLMGLLDRFTACRRAGAGPGRDRGRAAQVGPADPGPGLPGKGIGPASDAVHRRGLQQDVPGQRWQDHLDVFHRQGQRIRRRLDALQRQHSVYAHAVRRRDHAQEGSRLAIRRARRNRNPRLPADRTGQGAVRPERPAAQADGRQHQDQGRRGRARPAGDRTARSRRKFTRSSAACAIPPRERIWFRS